MAGRMNSPPHNAVFGEGGKMTPSKSDISTSKVPPGHTPRRIDIPGVDEIHYLFPWSLRFCSVSYLPTALAGLLLLFAFFSLLAQSARIVRLVKADCLKCIGSYVSFLSPPSTESMTYPSTVSVWYTGTSRSNNEANFCLASFLRHDGQRTAFLAPAINSILQS